MIELQLEGLEAALAYQAMLNIKKLAENEVEDAIKYPSSQVPIINHQFGLDSTNSVIAKLEKCLGIHEPVVKPIIEVNISYVIQRLESIGECVDPTDAWLEMMQLLSEVTMSHGTETKYRINKDLVDYGAHELDAILTGALYELHNEHNDEPSRTQMDYVINQVEMTYKALL